MRPVSTPGLISMRSNHLNHNATTGGTSEGYLARIAATTGSDPTDLASSLLPLRLQRTNGRAPSGAAKVVERHAHLHLRFAGTDWLAVLARLDAAAAARGIPTATFARALLGRWAEVVSDEAIVNPPKHLPPEERRKMAALLLPALAAARSRIHAQLERERRNGEA